MKLAFYDRYHQKNKDFYRPIRRNNFTYFYPLRYLHRQFPKGFAGVKVLDIACGVGALSFYLASQKAEVTGIDISDRATAICQRTKEHLIKTDDIYQKINFKKTSFEKLKTQKKYDLIICSEIIEHIEDDDQFLKKAKKLLKKDGLLYLSTPSPENSLYRAGHLDDFDREVGHLRRYSQKEIIEKLEKNKLKVILNKKVESPLRNLLFNNARISFLNRFIKGPLIPLFDLLDRFLINFFGYCDNILIARHK